MIKGAVFAFVFFVASIPAFAQAPQANQAVQPPARGQQRPMARLLGTPLRPLALQLRAAKLTPEQRQQVQGILESRRADLKAFAAKARAARQAWQQAGKIDINERKGLNEQRLALLQSIRTEILNVLTPEQRAQIEARGLKRRR